MITKLNSNFSARYKITTKKDLTEFAKKYFKEYELKEMLGKVNDYKNYYWKNDDDGFILVDRKSLRTYIFEIF